MSGVTRLERTRVPACLFNAPASLPESWRGILRGKPQRAHHEAHPAPIREDCDHGASQQCGYDGWLAAANDGKPSDINVVLGMFPPRSRCWLPYWAGLSGAGAGGIKSLMLFINHTNRPAPSGCCSSHAGRRTTRPLGWRLDKCLISLDKIEP